MPKTHYGLQIRAAICDHCGAPIQATIQGGQVRCSFCRGINLVYRREPPPPAPKPAPAVPSTQGRLQTLRLQDNRPLELPSRLQLWIWSGELLPRHRDAALQEWLVARKQLLMSGAGSDAHIVFVLALFLAPQLEDQHARALLENTVDVLPSTVDAEVIRCMLAHHAALEGDLEAARGWLSWVNPEPRLLLPDTAFRMASASIALARGRPHDVLKVLGRHDREVPIFDGFDDEAELLRCHALERLGAPEAFQRLWQKAYHPPALKPLAYLARRDPLRLLCPRTWPQVEEQVWALHEERLLEKHIESPATLVAVMFVIAIASASVATVWFLAGPTLPFFAALVPLGLLILSSLRAIPKYVEGRRLRRVVRRAYARVLATRRLPSVPPECGFVVEIELEGARYEVSGTLRGSWAHQGTTLPCLFDPETETLFLAAPQETDLPPTTPLPFG